MYLGCLQKQMYGIRQSVAQLLCSSFSDQGNGERERERERGQVFLIQHHQHMRVFYLSILPHMLRKRKEKVNYARIRNHTAKQNFRPFRLRSLLPQLRLVVVVDYYLALSCAETSVNNLCCTLLDDKITGPA